MNVLDTSSSSSSSEEEELIMLRRPKIYRERKNHFQNYDDLDFFDRFRLTKRTVVSILNQIEPQIALPTNRGGCVKPMLQLLLTLRFYASGNMQISVADFIGISRPTACRIIKRVSTALASLTPRYIQMPATDAEMQRTAEEFYNIASFPRTTGAIDCTLVRIDSTGGNDAEIFRCRKDGVYGRYLLVGDSGYTIQKYLMTKLLETHTDAENLYNESIIRTRNTVERQYGVWKRRFPILKFGMRMKMENIMNIIAATAVLHNIVMK
ncbi:hypothetical protein PPYR_02275 [Photinus pyralis]|uniref:DDE Tnp4 domain-containing protein n=1 Tax=Photinus pyralis TaxID=7054 RepID=A0A5N4B6T2_PHOPY|nr:hypothetical protein PPYR_02275 [Photinus pyralis]